MFEMGMEVVMEIEGKKATSRLLGWKFLSERKLLFLANPGASSGFLAPLAGQSVIMRMESEGVMTGFEAVYVDTLKKTDLLLFLVSQDIVTKTLRHHERFFCLLPVELISASTGEKYGEGMLHNLSAGGAGIYTAENTGLGNGDEMVISFNAGGLGAVKMIRLKIVRARSLGRRWDYAGTFIEPGKEQKAALENFFEFYRKWRLN